MSILFLVATPIGNLEDITTRALRVLSEVVLIAAEDTRQTQKLLNHFNIKTRLTSYFEHNKLGKLKVILDALAQGDVALVSDAGTPGLNDPGYELVRAVLESDHQVSPIPGPNAPVAALVASGLPTDRFLYLGYLPRKSVNRLRLLEDIQHMPYTLICLESPHRLLSTLDDVLSIFGDRQITVAREITKRHEEFFRGTISEAITRFIEIPPRGEITLVLSGASQQVELWTTERIQEAIIEALSRGETPTQIAKGLSPVSGWPRRQLYDRITEIRKQNPDS